MPYVITEKCVGERYAACVDVCPVSCIHPIEHQGKPFMIIDPDVCIDCTLCLPECPIGAIVDSPQSDQPAARLNGELAEAAMQWEKAHDKVMPRPPNEPPRRPDNRLVHELPPPGRPPAPGAQPTA